MVKNSKIKLVLSYWYVVLIIPFLIIGIHYFVYNSTEGNADNNSKELNLVVGFYISGESFSDDLINDDISDTLGLSNDDQRFYYLVDYNGFGNTEFFTGNNYTRDHLNISMFMPYDSTELNMGDHTTLSGFSNYISNIPSKLHCLVIWGHGKGSDGVCFDGSSSLKPNDINEVLSPLSFDLVVFDACEMASLEFLSEVGGISDFIIASEKDIPDRGIDYSGGFSNYFNLINIDPKLLGISLIDSTISYYQRNPSTYSVQLSLINMNEIHLLDDVTNTLEEKDMQTVPEAFESGNRVDLQMYLNVNGIDDYDGHIASIVIYQNALQSSSGLSIENVSGISVKPYS